MVGKLMHFVINIWGLSLETALLQNDCLSLCIYFGMSAFKTQKNSDFCLATDWRQS